MNSEKAPQLIDDTTDIANRLRFLRPKGSGRGQVVFLIGAGCSISAGIPGASTIAQEMVKDIAGRFELCEANQGAEACYRALVRRKLLDYPTLSNRRTLNADRSASPVTEQPVDWYYVYDNMFQRHYTNPDDVRQLFADIVTKANGAINWAHLCLGELVSQRFVSTVLTTNFDQLVLSGMVRAGVLPVVCDGVESLNRIAGAPSHPQLVELHGSRHSYLLRNSPADVAAIESNSQAAAAIQKLFQNAGAFVAVGYGGREGGIMNLLIQAAQAYRDKSIFWISHANDPDILNEKVRQFLATSVNARLLTGQDADRFFLDLSSRLGIGAPSVIARPTETIRRVIANLEHSSVTEPDITAEIEQAKARLERIEASLLTVSDGASVSATAASIRGLRLAGRFREAYEAAKKAIVSATQGPRPLPLAQVDEQLMMEAAAAALGASAEAGQLDGSSDAVRWLRHLLDRGKISGKARSILVSNYCSALVQRSGGNFDPGSLNQAVDLLKSEVVAFNRSSDPLLWATIQNALGIALQALGALELRIPATVGAGHLRLEEAVGAYRAALEERTRARVPLLWAETQNNLGAALQALGERESQTQASAVAGHRRLEEAVAAYRAALEEFTRDRRPFDWAMMQNNLGTVLQVLGERDSGTVRLEEAVAALRAALGEWTRARVPLQWADARYNLAGALGRLVERGGDRRNLDEAIACARDANEVWYQNNMTEYMLGGRSRLAKLEAMQAAGPKP